MKIKELLKNEKLSLSLFCSGAGIIILVTLLVLFSVFFRKKTTETKAYTAAQKDLIFDIGCKAVSGSSLEDFLNVQSDNNFEYPYSDKLKQILNHYFLRGKTTITLLELYYPEYYGIAEGLGYYIPSEDNALWVEETLVRAEEERIAKELHEMEESLEEYNDVEDDMKSSLEGEFDDEVDNNSETNDEDLNENETDDTTNTEAIETTENTEAIETEKKVQEYHSEKADSIEKALESDKEPSYFMNKKSELGILYNDGEILIPSKTEEGYSLILANENKVIRSFYNDKMRIVKKEIWPAKNMSSKKPDSVEEMSYSEDGKILVSKLIDSGTDYTLIRYNEEGLTKAVEKYVMYEDKKYTITKRSCTYNEDGKITTDETTDYVYSGTDYKKLKYSFTKKYTYEYNEGDIPPDFKYYENGVMKMYNKYASEKGTYTSQIFFDENLSVKSYYENDIHIRDVYYNGKTIMREKVYEQQQ